jgi:hypothetical protein
VTTCPPCQHPECRWMTQFSILAYIGGRPAVAFPTSSSQDGVTDTADPPSALPPTHRSPAYCKRSYFRRSAVDHSANRDLRRHTGADHRAQSKVTTAASVRSESSPSP